MSKLTIELMSERRIDLALEGEQLVEKLHQAAIF